MDQVTVSSNQFPTSSPNSNHLQQIIQLDMDAYHLNDMHIPFGSFQSYVNDSSYTSIDVENAFDHTYSHEEIVEKEKNETISISSSVVREYPQKNDCDNVTSDLEYISDKVKRGKCFSKRYKTILEKAFELEVLTGAEVKISIFNKDSNKRYTNYSRREVMTQVTQDSSEQSTGTSIGTPTKTFTQDMPTDAENEMPAPRKVLGLTKKIKKMKKTKKPKLRVATATISKPTPSKPSSSKPKTEKSKTFTTPFSRTMPLVKNIATPISNENIDFKAIVLKRKRKNVNVCQVCYIGFDTLRDKELSKNIKDNSYDWVACDGDNSLCTYWGHALCLGAKPGQDYFCPEHRFFDSEI